jgi:hypothetical protein
MKLLRRIRSLLGACLRPFRRRKAESPNIYPLF